MAGICLCFGVRHWRRGPGRDFRIDQGGIFRRQEFWPNPGFQPNGRGLASAVGPWVAGYIFDLWESYYWAFILVLVVQMLSLTAVAAASSQAKRRKR